MKKIIDAINLQISKNNNIKTDDISDGYHTFGELYKHRIILFIALCRNIEKWTVYPECIPAPQQVCTKSKIHYDGSDVGKEWGMFIMQLKTKHGQISYHLDNKYWDKCDFAETLETANKWDGHTSDDVLDRLLKL